MAKIGNHLIVNVDAPVRAYRRGDEGGQTRDFENLAAFERWYSPKAHGETRVVSHEEFTDVLVDRIDDPSERSSTQALIKNAIKRAVTARPTNRASAMVDVNGKKYSSVYVAFVELDLPVKAHQKFRKELKKEGTKTFNHGGKKFVFKTT